MDTQKLGKENLLQSHTKCGNIQYVFYFENRKHTQYIKFNLLKDVLSNIFQNKMLLIVKIFNTQRTNANEE